jgi:glycine cleavage system H lipoate-binding protein
MDFLATKGLEYLLVIGYLVVLIPFFAILLGKTRKVEPATASAAVASPALGGLAARAASAVRGWFRVPEGVYYHPGHTWAVPEGDGTFRIGLDDFALKLVGPPDALRLPEVGSTLEPGERGFHVERDGRTVALLAPVRGRVTEVNHEVLRNPALLADDPYGRGWLMKVRAPRPETSLKNLLPWRVARAWMEDASDALSARMQPAVAPALGRVLQDGGVPVAGLAREIDPDRWDSLAAELLLTG